MAQAQTLGARAIRFYEATIGKKAVMAATGVVLFGYIVGHLLGNLQVFLGREVINAYGAFLHNSPGLLWGTRVVLLVSVALHIAAATQLTLLKKKARPIAYRVKGSAGSDYAARTMIWSGIIILAFVVYHLLHLTFGSVHPSFVEGEVYDNLIAGFRVVPTAIAYVVAVSLLGMHLYHGLWSMFQSIGVNHPRVTPKLRRIAAGTAIVIALGYISIPVAILTGVLQ